MGAACDFGCCNNHNTVLCTDLVLYPYFTFVTISVRIFSHLALRNGAMVVDESPPLVALEQISSVLSFFLV